MAGESVGNAYLNVVPRVDGSAKSLGSKFGGELSSGASSALSAGAVALGNILSNVITSVASTAGEQLSKVFWNYADYEQLLGGVETLFKGASQTVQENAKNAFKTAGMSANEYMENVTSFSASLISSLDGDTVKAAEIADKAIIDMSDNANKMGTDMGRITDAYQGFAKQNYTMLDNLKLGYGGTKSEMERLLADASKIAGVEFDIDNYADVIEAIHVMQESMGITGTTMEEGSKTISGSINQLHGAWENFLTAIGDGGRTMDLDKVTNDLIESLVAVADNVVPAIMRIGESITRVLPPIIAEAMAGLPDMMREGLTNMFGEAGTAVADGLIVIGDSMAELFAVMQQYWPMIQEAVSNAVIGISNFIQQYWPTISEIIISVVTMVSDFIAQVWPTISDTIGTVMSAIMTIIETCWPVIQTVVQVVLDAISASVQATWPLISQIIQAAANVIRSVVSTVFPVIQNIVTTVFNAVRNVANAVWPTISSIVSTAANVIRSALNGLSSVVGAVRSAFNAVREAICNPIETAKNAISNAVNAIKGFFSGLHLEIPLPRVPHIDVDGGEAPWGIGGQGRLPSFNVSWAALGGFVNEPTLLGAGEAYTEMVLPKRGGLMDDLAERVTEHVGSESVVAELRELRGSLGLIIATSAPTATPRELKRINQRVNSYA